MRFRWIVVLLVLGALVAVVTTGCSEDQKQEAAKLEEEMAKQQESADTLAASTEGKAMDTQGQAAEGTMDAQAIPREEKKVSVPPAGPSGSGYAVQVASCESMDYAQYLIEKYRSRGYESYVTNFTHQGQTYYRVRLGPYETQNEAQSVKQELLDKYSLQTWIDLES